MLLMWCFRYHWVGAQMRTIPVNPVDGGVAVTPGPSSIQSRAHPINVETVRCGGQAYVGRGWEGAGRWRCLRQARRGFRFTAAALVSGLEDVRGWRGHCVGPGGTATPRLYVLPWTSYYFDADVRHFNFFFFYKCIAAERQETDHTCCALDCIGALVSLLGSGINEVQLLTVTLCVFSQCFQINYAILIV